MNLERNQLLQWYKKNYRKLPWRETTDPYKIWISEIMCQQTRVAAVLSYYAKFLERFPDVHTLAEAKEEDVLELWTGLGYYSRARNIHKAAKLFSKTGFPQSYVELIDYPGLGDYTSRAISSFAFQEKVGVLDGNVIRFLSRYYGAAEEHWTTAGKSNLQEIADHWAQESPEIVNQAMMEIGANLCLAQNPHCLLCPLQKTCIAKQHQISEFLPLKKPKTQKEFWHIHFYMIQQNGLFGLTKENDLPILKAQFLPPAFGRKLNHKPKIEGAKKHFVTHHNLFVTHENIDLSPSKMQSYLEDKRIKSEDILWVEEKDLTKHCQSSLVQKILFS